MGDFVEAFVAALDGGPAAAVLRRRGSATQLAAVAERSPYKGLRAFDEADAADFKGRARLVDRLVSGLSRGDAAGRLAVVVGPSGMGKSSVVRAGLLPALRHGAAPGSERWFVATMLPGREPFQELAAALLRVASAAPANLMGQLTEDHRGLARVLKALTPEGGDGAVLLVIDQFEELFTLCADDVARRRFLDSLEYALTDARCPIRLVVTMRADFYDRPLRHGSFARLIEPSTVAVTALAPDELEAAIVEPAASVGCEFEPGLVSEIVADIGDQPGALPLLQYALTELWERRVSGLLTRDAYRALGGVTGALGATAERLYAESSEAERLALRRLFGRLVTLGEGVEDTRRRVTVRELEADPALDAVVTRFGAARLLSFDRDPATREPTIEVAHEALLREWPRLREWLAEDRDGLRVVRHLTAASAAWEASGRDAGELYRGGRLESAQVWAAEHPSGLNQAETAFLSASTERQRAERAATRRQVRRLRGALAGVGVVAVLALLAGLLAVRQQRRADGEAALARRQSERADASAEQAETRRLVADAAALVGQNRDVALLLASEAYRRDPGPQTLAGLQRVLTSTGPYLGTIGAGLDFVGVDVLADGTIVGLTKTDLHFYDPETFALTAALALPAPPTEIYDVVPFDVRGAMVAVGNDQGSVLLVDGGVPRVLPLGTVPVRAVAVGDGVVAAATTDGQLHLVDAVTGVERWRTVVLAERSYEELLGPDRWAAVPPSLTSLLVGAEGVVFRSGAPSVLFDADGSVVVGGPRILRLDGASGRVLQQLAPLDATGLPRLGANLMARPGGGYVSASSNSVYTVDATLTAATFGAVPTGRADLNVNVRSLAIDPTGQPVYGLTNGQVARGIAESPLEGADNAATGLGSARGLRYRADGTLLVAGEGGIVVWGDDGRQLLAKAVPRTGHPGATVTPDGREVVTGTPSGTNPSARYDVGSQPPRRLPTPPLPPHWALAASPDPLSRFVEAFADGEAVRVFDRATLALVATIPDVSFGATSLDGRWMAQAQSFGNGNGVRVFDTTTWQQVSPMIDLTGWLPQTQSLGGVVPGFDATRSRLFTSIQETGTTIVFDTATWQPTTVIERADNGGVVAARFSRDGRVLVTLAIDGAIHERDPDTWAVKRTIAGGTSSSDNLDLGLYLSPDGAYLVTTRDARPRLWRLPTATLVGSFPHKNGLTASGADLGDQLQLVTLDDANVLLWNLDVTTWPAIACRAAGRNLTQAEWKQFGPKDVPRQQTCPQWPPGA
ncbi:MAG: AAA family ATPase [Acidimicrobiales bacterium]